MKRVFERDTAGEWILPLVVLSTLFFFDEFDTAATGTLAPDIERAFHMSDHSFIGLVTLNAALVTLLAVPVGYMADRVRRTPLVVVSGVVAGVFSFLTGFAGSALLLALFRFGNGIGLLANGPVHNSLLSDYYTPKARPGVFANHTNAVQLGGILGPLLAGAMGWLFGWRAIYYVLIIPILFISVIAARLPEPVRGGTDRDGAEADPLDLNTRSPKFGAAVRLLWSIKTLRYQFIGAVILGAGLLPLGAYLSLYYKKVFALGSFDRGLIGSAAAAATLVGVLVGGRLTTGWMEAGPGRPLRLAGSAVAGTGVGVGVVAAAPAVWVLVPTVLVTSFVTGLFFAPYYSVTSLVSPARVRSLSFSFVSIFLVIGVVVFYVSGLATVSDQYGLRAGLAVLVPWFLVPGAILAFTERFAAADAERVVAMLQSPEGAVAAEAGLLLGCRGLDASYGNVQVLFGVDLKIYEGEIVALLGTNGAGKSTVLKCISGLLRPDDGIIWFDGHDISDLGARERAHRGIIQMPGGRSVFPTLSVGECLRMAGWMYRRTDREHVRAATARVLDEFPVLAERRDELAGNLSGGEQQMLGLGMAFIAKPALLMIDELSLGLAPVVVSRLVDIVREIHAQGTTVVIVEQSVNVALTLAERAVFMEKGEVRFEGQTSELLRRPDLLRSVFLEGAGAKRKGGRRKSVPAPPIGPPVLELDRVSVHFGGIRAVNEVSFQLGEGEILGLIGPNGAGKTTLMDLISGYLSGDGGSIRLLGRDVTTWSPNRRAFAGLGRSFQDARLFPSLTVAENLGLSLERHLPDRDMLAAAMGMPVVGEVESFVAARAYEVIDLLGLGAYAHKFVGELSTGTRRIVDLGMSLGHRPAVLLLDEPSSGVAQRETEALGPMLVRIRDELNASLIVIEHDMPLITSISHRLIALETGTIIADGPPNKVVRDPAVIKSYLDADPEVIARSGALA